MKKAKVITICGSFKFIPQIMQEAERLTLEGNCVLSMIYTTKDKESYSDKDYKMMGELHFQKIEMSDAIFVVNVEGYIGESTKKEIEYAKSLNKEVMYLEKI